MSKGANGRDELSAGLQSLFHTARRAHDPTAADRARVDQAIAPKLKAEATTAAGASATRVVARTLTAEGAVKLSLGIVCVAVASLAVMRWSESRSVTAPVPQRPLVSTPEINPPTLAIPEERTPPAAPRAFESAPAPASKLERRARRRVQPPSFTPPNAEVRSTTELSATNDSLRLSPSGDARASDSPSDPTSRTPGAAAASSAKSVQAQRAEQAVEASSAHASSEAARADAADAWSSELMLVERMHGALRKRDFSAALALCMEHERRWSHGEFELEREGVRAIAGCAVRSGESGQRAQRYLDQHPRAPLAMRVRAACAPQLTAAHGL